MVVVFSLITDTFLTQANLLNILRQIAPLMIVAVAMTFVITTAGIDLSVGSVLALVNALAAISLQASVPWPAVVVLMLALGVVIGLVQGFFVAHEGIPAFIVTLAGLSAIRGTALLLTKGYSIPIDPQSPFNEIGRGWVFGVPMPAIIAVAVLVSGYIVFNETTFGRYVTGVGANAEAVRRAGVNTERITLSVYAISGLAAAMAGLIIAARLGSGSSNAGGGFELDVIAAVVLGGTSLFGGRGTMIGTMLGALDRRGHRQRPHSLPPLAVPDADRRGRHHPGRDLAEFPPVPDGTAGRLKEGARDNGRSRRPAFSPEWCGRCSGRFPSRRWA